MKTTNFSTFLSGYFIKHLPNEKEASRNTVKSYQYAFILLINFLESKRGIKINKISLSDVTKETIVSYLDWLEQERNCSASTRNVRLAAIHTFFKYIQYESIVHLEQCQQVLSIPFKKVSKKPMSYLSIDGMKLLLEQPNPKSKNELRDLALLSLMYSSAARVQEIIDLKTSDLNLRGNPTVILTGKGNKSRIVPLLNLDIEIISKYINSFGLDKDQHHSSPLFQGYSGNKLSRSGVNYILQKYFTLASKIEDTDLPNKISCHSLRHSRAMHLLQSEVDLIYIRDILGHVSVQTTEIYARADSKQKRLALEKANNDVNPKEIAVWQKDKGILNLLKSY